MAGELTWERGGKYYIVSIPAMFTVCKDFVRGVPHYHLYRGKKRLGMFSSATDAKAHAETLT